MQADATLSSIRTLSESPCPRSPQCDNYHPGSEGRLNRCCSRACYQLIILDSGHIGLLFRCQACRDELYADIERGVTFEVIDEVPVEALAVNELERQDEYESQRE